MENDWTVSYGGGFWPPHGTTGTPVAVEKHVVWNENHFYIPAVYVCGEGLVVDICMEVQREDICAFLDKWMPCLTWPREQSRDIREQMERENPITTDYYITAALNGRSMPRDRSCGISWIPPELLPEGERMGDEAEAVLTHYGLDREQGWSFHRVSLKWPGDTRQEISGLSITLTQRPRNIPGTPFVMPGKGESVEIPHPFREETYTLTVEEISHKQLPERFMEENKPSHAVMMACTLSPDLSGEHFQIRDTAEDERRAQKEHAASVGIIGGADGPTAIAFLTPNQPHLHCAVSSMRYNPTETVIWQPIFREKMAEDMTVELL